MLKSIEPEEMTHLLKRALQNKEHGLGGCEVKINEDMLRLIAMQADGDARRALNFLEISVDLASEENGQLTVNENIIHEVTSQTLRRFDKGGDLFLRANICYAQVSAWQ